MSILKLSLFQSHVAKYLISVIFIVIYLLWFAMAPSAQTIRIEVNKASILKLTQTPSTIIIGNPALADITPQDNNVLVLVGKASGRTNIIILDDAGNVMHNYDIAIQEEQSGNLTMFRAGKQWSYSCAPYCERVINPNDDSDAFGANLSQVQAKADQMSGAANSENTTEDAGFGGSLSGAPTNGAASAGFGTQGNGMQGMGAQMFKVLPPTN